MNKHRVLKKVLKIIIITIAILFVLPAILLQSCYYIFRDPVKVTKKYLAYECYDEHLVALKRTEEIGKYRYDSPTDWRYRKVAGESTDTIVYVRRSWGGVFKTIDHYVLQNSKYYFDIRKEWTINQAQLISNYYLQRTDSGRIEGESYDDLGSALYQNKVNTFDTTADNVILKQIYDLINNGSYDETEGMMGNIFADDRDSVIRMVLTFSESENIAWVTDISRYPKKDSAAASCEYGYMLNIGRGENHKGNYMDDGVWTCVLIPMDSELHEWISQAYQSQAYIDYCTLEDLNKQ